MIDTVFSLRRAPPTQTNELLSTAAYALEAYYCTYNVANTYGPAGKEMVCKREAMANYWPAALKISNISPKYLEFPNSNFQKRKFGEENSVPGDLGACRWFYWARPGPNRSFSITGWRRGLLENTLFLTVSSHAHVLEHQAWILKTPPLFLKNLTQIVRFGFSVQSCKL